MDRTSHLDTPPEPEHFALGLSQQPPPELLPEPPNVARKIGLWLAGTGVIAMLALGVYLVFAMNAWDGG